MKESEYLPEEVKCFVCLKLIDDYRVVVLAIQCKDSTVCKGVPVCEEDFIWARDFPDAARALFQARLERIVNKDETN